VRDIFHQINRELDRGQEVVLATIITQKGSTPRAPGTRFMVRPDGSFEGTIGGGKVEADILSEASEIFKERKNRTIRFRLTGEEAAETEMICGGELEIHLELFSGKEVPHQEFFKKVSRLLRSGKSGMVVTRIEDRVLLGPPDSKFLYEPEEEQPVNDRPWMTEVKKFLPEILTEGQNILLQVFVQGKETRIFLEPLLGVPHLYLFGAGHVSAALCPLAKRVGFRVTVFDDRTEFAHPGRFPEADDIIVRPLDRILKNGLVSSNAFAVIMTRGHLHDYQVLRQVISHPFRYIGMIGSRHKRDTIFKSLRRENFSEDLISSIHTPIGLDINAETPEEIAVSIVAELIQVRNQNPIWNKKVRIPQ
jgi:xanthine dehydrogenase accessory factor